MQNLLKALLGKVKPRGRNKNRKFALLSLLSILAISAGATIRNSCKDPITKLINRYRTKIRFK